MLYYSNLRLEENLTTRDPEGGVMKYILQAIAALVILIAVGTIFFMTVGCSGEEVASITVTAPAQSVTTTTETTRPTVLTVTTTSATESTTTTKKITSTSTSQPKSTTVTTKKTIITTTTITAERFPGYDPEKITGSCLVRVPVEFPAQVVEIDVWHKSLGRVDIEVTFADGSAYNANFSESGVVVNPLEGYPNVDFPTAQEIQVFLEDHLN